MAEKKISVMELVVARAVERHGFLKGGRVGGRMTAFVIEWAQYQRETGEAPGGARAFGRWANVPHATAIRRLAEFRELFPEHETPAPLARYVGAPRTRRASSSSPLHV
jgi:hypothetical protein